MRCCWATHARWSRVPTAPGQHGLSWVPSAHRRRPAFPHRRVPSPSPDHLRDGRTDRPGSQTSGGRLCHRIERLAPLKVEGSEKPASPSCWRQLTPGGFRQAAGTGGGIKLRAVACPRGAAEQLAPITMIQYASHGLAIPVAPVQPVKWFDFVLVGWGSTLLTFVMPQSINYSTRCLFLQQHGEILPACGEANLPIPIPRTRAIAFGRHGLPRSPHASGLTTL